VLGHTTMTIDGFVAGAADDMSWMTPYFGADEIVDQVLPQIGALLVGARPSEGS